MAQQAPPEECSNTPQLTPNPYKDPKTFGKAKLVMRPALYPLFASSVVLGTQYVNPYFLNSNSTYETEFKAHFRFIFDRVAEKGISGLYRGFIPNMVASFDFEVVKSLLTYLQMKGYMPVNPQNLKTRRRRRRRRVGPDPPGIEQEQAEIDHKEADRLRTELKNTPITLKSTLKYFICDFGARTLSSVIFWPLRLLSVGQVADLHPDPEFETFAQRAVSIFQNQGFGGFFRGLKFKLLANLLNSIAYTAEWSFRANWFGITTLRRGFNSLLLQFVTVPLAGFSRMRMISDCEIDWFSTETGAGMVLRNTMHIPIYIVCIGVYKVLIEAAKFGQRRRRRRNAAQNGEN